MAYKLIEGGGVTTPKGFLAGACYVGVKSRKSEKPDVAIIYSEQPASCAAMFTTNKFCAAPVILDREILKKGKARAVVINSGNANAATGTQGIEDAKRVETEAEKLLNLGEDEVFVCSTGVIGQKLPVEKVLEGVRRVVPELSADKGSEAAWAIMTTDLVRKETAMELELSGGTVRVGAMAKGSGMIHPNMGTMLCGITTDCAIDGALLQDMLRQVVTKTFNRITVDGDTSTNDTCVVLANGLAGNPAITGPGEDYDIFFAALRHVCEYEAKMIASDGEGAGRLITCTVMGAETEEQAEQMAKAVVRSPLVKCAVFGTDANWGRVLCAIGYSGAQFDPKDVEVKFLSRAGELLVCAGGQGVAFDEALAKRVLSEDEVVIQVTLTSGSATCSCWGCDLTYDYVKINGDYRS